MALLSDSIIDEVRQRTDIVEVIGRSVRLKRSSGGWVGLCPFHHEKTPSFHVNESRQTFKCFGCGKGGDVFRFLMENEGMTFVDAVRFLAEKCGVEIKEEEDDGAHLRLKRLYKIESEAADFFRRCLLQTEEAAGARAYLRKRGLGDDIAEKFRLGYSPMARGTLNEFAAHHHFTIQEMMEAGLGTLPEQPGAAGLLRNRFYGRLMFPICDHLGRVVAFSARVLDKASSPAKYVNSPETAIFKKSHILYALDKAQRAIANSPHREAIICEGQIDVIRCHACGFPRAVASEGTAFTAEHAKLLHRYADSVVELFDSDKAGRKAAIRTAGILLAEGLPVRIATLPEGEDPDSFLLKHPQEDFQKILDEAQDVVPFQIAYLKANESDPDGAGAAGRIVKEVLQIIAVCRNAVHRERMQQDLAKLMRLSTETIRDEMEGVQEALHRQAQNEERRESFRNGAVVFPAPATKAYPNDATADLPGGGAESGTPEEKASPTRGIAASPLDVSVCEFLLNHCLDAPGTLNALSRYMPSTLFSNEVVRRIIDAFYASVGASTDPVYDLQKADAEVSSFLGRISVQRDRTGSSEGYQPKDVAHDLICKAWARHLQGRIDESLAKGEMTPDAVRQRMEAMRSIRKLRSWQTGQEVVLALCGLEKEEAERLSATALSQMQENRGGELPDVASTVNEPAGAETEYGFAVAQPEPVIEEMMLPQPDAGEENYLPDDL
ncbi:MAG: DNA primase [Kiritimatiellia bacterium]